MLTILLSGTQRDDGSPKGSSHSLLLLLGGVMCECGRIWQLSDGLAASMWCERAVDAYSLLLLLSLLAELGFRLSFRDAGRCIVACHCIHSMLGVIVCFSSLPLCSCPASGMFVA